MKPRKLYLSVRRPDHPLAVTSVGRVRTSRLLMWEKLNGQGTLCHWCGVWLTWDDICVDHLDSNTRNNDIDNLVPSCRGCNANREDGTGFGRRPTVPCATCGEPFVPRNPSIRFCSRPCGYVHSAQIRRGRLTSLHGTRSRYQTGCRCDACVTEVRRYWRERSRQRREANRSHVRPVKEATDG
jgi:hypothetical protein